VTPGETVEAVRRGAGLFVLEGRGVLVVGGGDRVRWAQGMLSADVAALEAQGPGAGCYTLLLTAQGRVVADFHVLLRADALWLETERFAIPEAIARLEKFVIADDVLLGDQSGSLARLAIEGPRAPAILQKLLGRELEQDAWADVEIAGVACMVAAYALAGGPGFQLFAPAEEGASVRTWLLELGAAAGLVEASSEAFEILRIEGGVPWLGLDLDESVLPDEAGLEHAVSTTKGCYTGQEVVARMRSRGRISHRLVGLRADALEPLRVGAEVLAAGRRIGEVTSATQSPSAGPIALAYLRVPHDADGTDVEVEGIRTHVVQLPFVPSTP
jgi:folate-binding protein YgfZ